MALLSCCENESPLLKWVRLAVPAQGTCGWHCCHQPSQACSPTGTRVPHLPSTLSLTSHPAAHRSPWMSLLTHPACTHPACAHPACACPAPLFVFSRGSVSHPHPAPPGSVPPVCPSEGVRFSLSGSQKEPGVRSRVPRELQPLREVMRARRIQCDMACPQPSRGAKTS